MHENIKKTQVNSVRLGVLPRLKLKGGKMIFMCHCRYSYSERLVYSYVFALVVLLPASLYLEEAFEALNFQHRRQMRFLLGSVFSAGKSWLYRVKERNHFQGLA